MRSSYGTVDQKKVLAYKPQLFQRSEDLLIFPGRDFHKWQNEILELIEGIYQINAKNCEEGCLMDVGDFNLAMGVLKIIDRKLDNIFNPSQSLDFNYHYVSLMDEKYKKRKPVLYGRYRYKIDRKVFKISPRLKHIHLMEIVDYASKLWWEESKKSPKMVKKQ
ncbi:MAG: hypothetical protein HVN35_08725 [Methanobacteriaceae archaeon]|nr:hypothetical protein [Methanobacteriaceae archaeon]